jgi:hypothetical protein
LGDGAPASAAGFYYPYGVAVDGTGNLYISDTHHERIRKVSAAGIVSTVVGGAVGDGAPAVFAQLYEVQGIAKDSAGNLYIADSTANSIRKVAPNGIITTVAGTGTAGQDGSLTDTNHPAAHGSVITVYMSGLGPLDNPAPTNTATPGSPLSHPTLPSSATIGGQNAPIQFIGLTPGSLALAQANITVPSLNAGDYALVITIGGTASNGPLITVGGN